MPTPTRLRKPSTPRATTWFLCVLAALVAAGCAEGPEGEPTAADSPSEPTATDESPQKRLETARLASMATALAPGDACTTDTECDNGTCDAGQCLLPTDCIGWLAVGGTTDGLYTIDPDGGAGPVAPFDVYCDQTTDGGGWMLASKFSQHQSIGGLAQTVYDGYFVNRPIWIEGGGEGVPQSPTPVYDTFHVESLDWGDVLRDGGAYQLRSSMVNDAQSRAFDVIYDFTFNGFLLQNDAPEDPNARGWVLSNRNVLEDTTGIVWDLDDPPERFWLPYVPGFSGNVWSGCAGAEYSTDGCSASDPLLRRFGNAGIIGSVGDGQDPAGAWIPHTNTSTGYDIVFVHQQTSVFGATGQPMSSLYWLRAATTPVCGNGVREVGETCDTGGESASCDEDCTAVSCGDGTLNEAAGEVCDGTADCSASCLLLDGQTCTDDTDCDSALCDEAVCVAVRANADDFDLVDDDGAGTADLVIAEDGGPYDLAAILLGNDESANGSREITGVDTTGTSGTVEYDPSGMLTYQSAPDDDTTDTFTYTMSNGFGAEDTATVTIDIAASNDAPVANPDLVALDEGNGSIVDVLFNDTDIDSSLSYGSVGLSLHDVGDDRLGLMPPSHGTVTLTATGVRYDHDGSESTTDSFGYRVCETDGACAESTVSVNINPVNDAPTFAVSTPTTSSAVEGGEWTQVFNADDVDSPSLTFAVTAADTCGGIVDASTGNYAVTRDEPNATDCVVGVQVCDDGAPALCDTATVALTVTPFNDAPVITNAPSATATEDVTYTFDFDATDVDDTDLTWSLTGGTCADLADDETLDPTTGSFSFTPSGPQPPTSCSLSVAACDDEARCDDELFTLVIDAVNDAPVAVADAITVAEDASATAIDVLGNDVDVDDAFTVTAVTQPANGMVTFTATGVSYTPNADFAGTDTFDYTITDASGATATATVTVTVTNVNDAPVLTTTAPTTATEDVVYSYDADATDIDSTSLTFALAAGDTCGGAIDAATGLYTFTPAGPTPAATCVVAIEACDDAATPACDVESATVTITATNDAPMAQATTGSTDEDNAVTVTLTGTDPDGDALTFATSGESNGTVTLGTPTTLGDTTTVTATFDPTYNFAGAAGFQFTVTDGTATSAAATVAIDVNAVNDAPWGGDQLINASEDTQLVITLTGEDVEGEALTFALDSGPAHGSLGTITPLSATIATVTYTPDADYTGADELTYTVTDASGATSQVATVWITLDPVDDPAVAVADAYTTDEDTTLTLAAPGVLTNDTDVEGDAIAVVSNSAPAHGTISVLADGSFEYVPSADFHGTDSFTYTVTGGATATVSVDVSPVNDAPVAAADGSTTAEENDVTIDVLANDSDIDGDALTVSAVTQPAHGTVTLAVDGSSVTYSPEADYQGADTFTYTVADGQGGTATGTVDVTVTNVNDAPTVSAITDRTTNEDVALGPIPFTVGDTESAAGTLTVTVTSSDPSVVADADLVLGGTDGDRTLTLTPVADASGTATVTVTVSDGQLSAASAFVVTVAPINDAPVAAADAITVSEDAAATAVDVLSNDDDIDDAFTVTAVTQPAHGSATFTATGVSYTPNADFAGTDTFDYTITDASGATATATVTVTVTPGNDAPVAVDDTATTNEEVAVTLDVLTNDSDIDGDALTVTSATTPAHGTVTVAAASVTYTPSDDFAGTDSFDITIDDGQGGTATATVTVTVLNVNDAPVLTTTAPTSATEDAEYSYDADASDIDSTVLTFSVDAGDTCGGAIDAATGIYTFTPAGPTPAASCTVSVTVCDAAPSPLCDIASVLVTVTEVNDAPVANNTTATVAEDDTATVIDVLAGATDADGDTLTVTAVTQPANGSATFTATGISYTPAADFHGTDTFDITVDDGRGATDTATVTVTVTPVNDAPVAVADAATTAEETAVDIDVLTNDSDIDGDTLSVTATTTPAHGTAAVNAAGGVTYSPSTDFEGTDSFDVTIGDGQGGSATATVTVTVTNTNDAPTVSDIADQSTPEDTATSAIAFTIGDVDDAVSGLTVTVSSDDQSVVADADLVLGGSDANRTLTVTPVADAHGTATVTVSVSDGTATASDTFVVTVSAVNDVPVGTDDVYSTDEDTPLTVDAAGGVLSNDDDIDGDALTAVLDTDVQSGTLTLSTDGSFEYSPDADFVGQDSFTYLANDGTASASAVTVTLNVGNTNDAPVLDPLGGPYMVTEGDTLDVTLTATDADSDALTFSSPDLPTGAMLSSGGQLTWTPTWEDAGSHTVTIEVTDGTEVASEVMVVMVGFVDADLDSLPDTWEPSAGLDPTTRDSDGDTLDDATEVFGLDGLGTLEMPLDTDADSTIDALDVDSEEDGIADADEAGDDDLDTAPIDTDEDGTPDYLDTDSDDDTLDDGADNCRLVENTDQADLDGDLTGDVCDDDRDGDGASNADETALGIDPDNADTDGDTIADGTELGATPLTPLDTDADGIPDVVDLDSDADSIADADEAGDADLGTDPVDTDGDGMADYVDADSDDDTVLDGRDNCRLVANTDQLDSDADGVGDACTDDADGDGIVDAMDNCPVVANADQVDLDGDAEGDACDADLDGDMVDNELDNCVELANADQLDTDMDGQGDACDPVEVCTDGTDNDADGDIDCDDADCAGESVCSPVADDPDMGSDVMDGTDTMGGADMMMEGAELEVSDDNSTDCGCTTVRDAGGSETPWPLGLGVVAMLLGLVGVRRRRRR